MFQLRKILFPVDFSDSCRGASAFAAAFAGRFQAELTLLHVVDTSVYMSPSAISLGGFQSADLSQDVTKWARETLGTYSVDEFKHFDVRRTVVQGDPAQQIVSIAKQAGADLIMMPSHGLSAFRRYILGSVTAKVLHDADCPVWTGVHLENAPPLDTIRFARVLCAVDLGPQSEKALRWAAAFSKEHSAELLAVHAIPEVRLYEHFDLPPINRREDYGREQLRDLLRKLGITARMIVTGGEPAKAVSEIARTENVDQMVIARGAAAEGFGRLRTHAYALIRSAPCPVVSI
jgi:nucleotide-binding universal stress UspA family protein